MKDGKAGPKRVVWKVALPLLIVVIVSWTAGHGLPGYHDRWAVQGDGGGNTVDGAGATHAEVELLRQQVQRLESDLRSRNRTAATNPLSRGDSLRAREAYLREAPARNREEVRVLEAKFARSPRDPSWSQAAEWDLSTIIDSDIPKAGGAAPVDRQVECRDGACSIAATFSQDADLDAWTDAMVAGIGSSLPRTRIIPFTNADGGTTLRIFAVRNDRAGMIRKDQRSER